MNLARAVVANPNYKEVMSEYERNLGSVLEAWSRHLSAVQWVLGDRITYVDFMLYEGLDWNHEFKPDAFAPYPALVEYLRRFEELPGIKEYMASGAYNKWPMLSPKRVWGYRKEAAPSAVRK